MEGVDGHDAEPQRLGTIAKPSTDSSGMGSERSRRILAAGIGGSRRRARKRTRLASSPKASMVTLSLSFQTRPPTSSVRASP
jgi:hypothetical protein